MIETASNIAKDFKIGNTRIQIATDYCENKTPEEVQEILRRIAITAQRNFIAERNKNLQ